MAKRILALDLSLTKSGVCRVLDVKAGQPVYEVERVEVPVKIVPGKRPGRTKQETRVGVERLLWWRSWMQNELAGNDYSFVAVEAPGYGANHRGIDLGGVYCLLMIACHEAGVPLVMYAPNTLKKFATGKGNSDKQRMVDMATERFGEQIAGDEDLADAAWLCACAYEKGEVDNPASP